MDEALLSWYSEPEAADAIDIVRWRPDRVLGAIAEVGGIRMVGLEGVLWVEGGAEVSKLRNNAGRAHPPSVILHWE